MNIPKFSVANHRFVLIVILLTVAFGIFSYLTMPWSEDPVIRLPNYGVIVVYPGTSPEDIEEIIVNPIEEEINELDDIAKIQTSIEEGLANIRIEAEFGIDIDDKYDEISAAVNRLRPELPADIFLLDILKFSPTDVLIFQLAIASETASYSELKQTAEDLEHVLQNVPGVRSADVEAYPEPEIRVSLDFEKMVRQNIPLAQVIGVLQGNNRNIPGGAVDAGGRSFSIRTSGEFRSLAEIRNTIIAGGDGGIVRLGDVAAVDFSYEDDRWRARHNGVKCVYVSVTQKERENIILLSDRVREAVESFRQRVTNGIRIEYAFIQAPAVEKRIDDFLMNLFQGILLVGIIILLFLGWRPSLIVMTVIPVSIMIAIGILNLTGFNIQQISIASLVLALGLLVDNGIVVVENIMRYRTKGEGLIPAALKGTAEVGPAIISATITTLLAFFPLTQLGGGTGEFVKSLPLTVIYTLVASLALALTLTPILAGRYLTQRRRVKQWVLRRVEGFIERRYRPALAFALRRPFVIIGLASLAFAGAILVFPAVGVSFFPTADKPLLLIEINTPEGSNLNRTDRAVRYVESLLDTNPYVASYTSNTGHGNPRVYYNRIPENYKKTHGQIMITMADWRPRQFYDLMAGLRRTFRDYADAKITLSELKNGPPFAAPIEIKIIGEALPVLKQLAADIERIIADTEGTLNVDNPVAVGKTDIRVDINREKAGLLGVPLAEIDLAVRTALTGLEVDRVYFDDGEEYGIVVRLPLNDVAHIEDLQRIFLAGRAGGQIPLVQLADITFEQSIPSIDHYDLRRTATVTADVYDADQTAAITEKIIARLEQYDFPDGYDYFVAGEYETQQESFGDLGASIIFALIGIFAVLVLQFRSLTQPLVVFSAIPFAFIGSILALLITGWSFSFLAFVGFTSLVGIVVNNSIILVDFINQLRRDGIAREEAIRRAAETRFVPIVLTSLTTILGLLPLTLSSTSLWSPLGWTIIGGMVTSTILVLLIVPVLYQWFSRTELAETAVE